MASTHVTSFCCCWKRHIYKPLAASAQQSITNVLDRVVDVDDPWLVEEMLQELTKTQRNWEKAAMNPMNIKSLSDADLKDLFEYARRKIEKNRQTLDGYKTMNERLLGTKSATDAVLSDSSTDTDEAVKAVYQQLKQSFSNIDKQIEANKSKMEELIGNMKSQMSTAEAIKEEIGARSSEKTASEDS